MSDLSRAREALCRAAVERENAYDALMRCESRDELDLRAALERARTMVLHCATAYARAAREEGEKHGK